MKLMYQYPFLGFPSFADVRVVDNGVSCAKNIKESDELQRSIGNQIGTRNHYGSGPIIQESHELQSSFGDQIYTRDHSGSANNMQENHELQRSSAEQINTRSHFVDNGSSGENIQGSYELQKLFGDPLNARSHFGIGESIWESHELQRSFSDQINSRSNLIDSHEVQRTFGNQINSGSHLVDNRVSYEKNIQDSHELQRSSGNQSNTRSHFGFGNNIESHEVQRSFGQQIKKRGHVGFQKTIEDDNGLLRSSSEQINETNYFGDAPDWWIYERILKEQTASASELCRIIKDSSTTSDSLAVLPPNLSNGSISEASPSGKSFMKNHNTMPYNRTASIAHGTSSVLPRNISNGSSILDASPFQCTFTANTSRASLTANSAPDSSVVLPLNISNGTVSEASPFERNGTPNLSTVPHNPTSTSSPVSSIDVVLYSDPLGLGAIAAASSQMNGQSRSTDEVKNLQMDAIKSSISFDNLLRAIS